MTSDKATIVVERQSDANTNHFTILDELRQPTGTLTRAVIAIAEYQTV